MSGNKKVTPEEKLQAVHEYLDGKGGFKAIAKKYGVSYRPFRKYHGQRKKNHI